MKKRTVFSSILIFVSLISQFNLSRLESSGNMNQKEPNNKINYPENLGKKAGNFHYGAPFSGMEITSLENLHKNIDQLEGQSLFFMGEIKEVCQKKGCWMILSQGNYQVRVKFKDYSFFVPKDAHKRSTLIQAIAKKEVLSESMAKHYAEEGKNRPKDLHKIKGPQNVIHLTAEAVEIH